MIVADIHTSNPDRHGKNWGVLIKDNIAELAPNFDYDLAFSQNEYAMKGIAEAIENKDKKLGQKIMEKYNVKRFTGYLKNTVYNIGLEIGEGEKFQVDTDLYKYSFKDTSKYIKKELGEKEYEELINKVDIDKALPKQINKDHEIYSLLAKLHNCSTREKIAEPKIDDQER
jgi:mRNA-degrading endonuclease YafQ of YafQ-DinJ toxin-antitoxin module